MKAKFIISKLVTIHLEEMNKEFTKSMAERFKKSIDHLTAEHCEDEKEVKQTEKLKKRNPTANGKQTAKKKV